MATDSEYSSGGDNHHSQPPSLRRTKTTKAQAQKHQREEQSLHTRIIGPAKSRVTKVTKKADLLLAAGQQTTHILSQLLNTPETEGRQDTLKAADKELLQIKGSVHKLTSLYNYVDVNFNDPAMNASPLKAKHLEEVYSHIEDAKPYEMATQLQETIFSIEGHLKELGYPISSYTPPDEYLSETEDIVKQRVQLNADTNSIDQEPMIAPQMPTNTAKDPEQTRKLLEMETEVKRLQAQLDNQKIQALLKERELEQKASERESWHLKQFSSVQKTLLETLTKEAEAKKRAAQLKAEAEKEKNPPLRSEETPITQQNGNPTPSSGHPISIGDPSARSQILDRIRAGNPTTLSTEQIRAGNPTTQATEQIRAGIPTTQLSDQIRAGNPTTGIYQRSVPSREVAPDVNQAMLEVLQKIHEEALRSNTDIRSSLEILLNQREREQDESYADQYENAFAGTKNPRGREHQANSGPFSSAGSSQQDIPHTQPQPTYQMSPYVRKFDPTKYLSTFDGTGDLEHFQYEFDAYVTQEPNYSDKDRFLILRKVLVGQARQHLNSSKNPQEAISKTFALLEKTYGNNQTQTSLLTKLVNLPFHPSDPQQMRQNLANIISLLEQLKNKGVPENDPRTINDVVRKLPISIRRSVCEFMVQTGDSVTHNQIIDKIYEKIAGLDMDKSILSQGATGRSMNEITDSFGAIHLVEASGSPHTGSSSRPFPQKSQAPKSNNIQKPQVEKAPLAYVKEGLPRQYTDPVTGQTLEGYYAPGSNRPDIKIMHRTFPYKTPEKSKCPVCEGPHNAIRCTLTSTDFRKLSAEKGLCPICAAKHTIEECRSPYKCGYCGGTHHMGGCPKKEFYRDPKNYPTGAKDREQFCQSRKLFSIILLEAWRLPNNGELIALVDSGASLSVICSKAAHTLNLPIKRRTNLAIQSFNRLSRFNSEVFALSLKTTTNMETLTFLITGADMPNTLYTPPELDDGDIKYAFNQNIDLRRMLFSYRYKNHSVPMILGNDVLAWIGAQPTYVKYTLPTGRSLEVTPLGVIVNPVPNLKICKGPPSIGNPISESLEDLDMFQVEVKYATLMLITEGLEPENEMTKLTYEVAQMRRLENLGIENLSVTDETNKTTLDLLTRFNETVRYNSRGELEVALPYNGNQSCLADNRAVATRRLISMLSTLDEKRLVEYDKIFRDQLTAHYIEVATTDTLKAHKPVYFIPHRAVFKEDSLTTKLRVVLDASSHARGQLSLNDCLHAGTNMITPIFGILLRTRCTKFIIVADIAKAFHQVKLQEEFRNVTCFLWLKDIHKPPTDNNIMVYRSTVIPFGVSSSPFLLAAYITYNLDNNPDDINKDIRDNLYVDNALFGTNDPDKIMPIIRKTKATFANMSMNLREYCVNHDKIMDTLDPSVATSAEAIKLLGYTWDRKADTLAIKIAILDTKHPTKRDVASKLAETFDPLGLVSPIMVAFKRLIQKLWSHDMNWKDKIPVELLPDWHNLQKSFQDTLVVIPRQLTDHYDYDRAELLIFSDASQDIYACMAYTCFLKKGCEPRVQLLASKNKIRPSKNEKWTIPKLELLGIECGSTLACNIIAELRIKIDGIRLFTDSSCALYWILSHQNKRVWVANRIEKIQSNQLQMKECGIETTIHHCPTADNPADLATRGMTTSELQNSTVWFGGPEFLKNPPSEWPCMIEGKVTCPAEFQELVYAELTDPVTSKKKKPMLKKATAPPVTEIETLLLIHALDEQGSIIPFAATNSLPKLVRIVATIIRMFTKARPNRQWDTLAFQQFAEADTLTRQAAARSLIIREHYKDSILLGYPFPPPFQYTFNKVDGLYRARRNVASSVLPAEAREPILIIGKHPLAAMIVRETHINIGHYPEEYVRSAFRTKYWIHQDGILVRQVIRTCVSCKKTTGLPYAYPFSKVLPESRTISSKPFSKVGLDYLGPVEYIKDDGVTIGKAYVLIYTCMCTRGAILRVVPDSTSYRYVMTLKMIFREVGVPLAVYSDNAAAFRLGASVINADIASFEYSTTLTTFLASESVDYKFIVPLAPWQGGVYERVVQIVKRQIRKECGNAKFDYHSLQYLVSGAQGMINNRPLTPHSRSPGDMVAIRPMDFINPGVMIELPENIHTEQRAGPTETYLRLHLKELEKTLERMWEIWASGYLSHLRQNLHRARKCTSIKPSVGQVVIVAMENVRRHKWPLGIITKVNRSPSDNEIRSAVVRCKGKEVTRAVCLLIPLEVTSEEEAMAADLENSGHPESGNPGNTDPIDAYKSRPVLPTPATLGFPDMKHAPELFPESALPNIAEQDEDPTYTLTSEQFEENIGTLPTVGQATESDTEDDIPSDDVSSGNPNLRKAKSTHIDYVHSIEHHTLSLPSPRECCRMYRHMHPFDYEESA
ncbi:hypothetical protein CAEBREN_32607 [Caenorhabditis brenneri]|uniref:Integrase catalytic domain-containing protein n=1 Tax=Caenorhabditis brenneri TaxID=135651 RepID=G0P580_CAEBE|nr:hypothetical protein CAEBREN_32607 [Caenorhabditis brenneri]